MTVVERYADPQNCKIAVHQQSTSGERKQKAWLYAAIDVGTKIVLHVKISQRRDRNPAEQLLASLTEKGRAEDAELLVYGLGYVTALGQTKLTGDLNYSDQNIVEKLFQTFRMRID